MSIKEAKIINYFVERFTSNDNHLENKKGIYIYIYKVNYYQFTIIYNLQSCIYSHYSTTQHSITQNNI